MRLDRLIRDEVDDLADDLGVTRTALHELGLRTVLMVVGELRAALPRSDNGG